MNKVQFFIFFVFTLCLNTASYAQVVEVNAWLDTSAITIGEQVKLHLDIKKDPKSEITFPELKDTISTGIEIIKTDSGENKDKQLSSRVYTITSFDSGRYELPSLPFVFRYNGITDTIYSSPLLLEVQTPVVDTTKTFMDIKAPLNTPLTLRETIPYILGSAGALLIAALIAYLIFRYRKKKPVFSKPVKVLPAHVIAFGELDILKEEKLWQSGNIKEYYVRLSDTIRKYLENRYGFNALECVTGEIMTEFKKVDRDGESTVMLREILQTSDMVKFAKGDPLPSDNQMNLDNAYLFVEKTKFIELVSVEELEKSGKANVYK